MKNAIKYTAEFKRDAVELLLSSNKTLKEVARDLGIHPVTLRDWRKRALIHESNVVPPAKDQSIAELHRELNQLKEQMRAKDRACEILKKP